MERSQLSPQDLQDIRDLARQWGKIIARRIAPAGEAVPTRDFSALEAIARAAADGLTEGTLDALLRQLAQDLPDQLPCPGCGHLCPRTSHTRPLVVQTGQTIQADEPVAHCPACRRDFFPPAHVPAAGQPRLQSRPATADR